MSDSKRPQGSPSRPKDQPGGAAPKDNSESLSSSGRSGRVAFDSRGNPIWEWQTSTGVYERDVSTQRLKKLQAEELSIADTQSVAKPKGLELQEPTQLPGGGVNPYNTGPAKRGAEPKQLPKPAARTQATASPKQAQRTPPPSKPQGTWQRIKSKLLREDD